MGNGYVKKVPGFFYLCLIILTRTGNSFRNISQMAARGRCALKKAGAKSLLPLQTGASVPRRTVFFQDLCVSIFESAERAGWKNEREPKEAVF